MSSLLRLSLRTPFLYFYFFYFLATLVVNFFVTLYFRILFLNFFVFLRKVRIFLKKVIFEYEFFLVLFCHFSGKLFLLFFICHKNQVPCCTLVLTKPMSTFDYPKSLLRQFCTTFVLLSPAGDCYTHFITVSSALLYIERSRAGKLVCSCYWPAPPSIHRGLEWPQSLNRLSVLCLCVCKFSNFSSPHLLFYSTVSSVIGPLPRVSTED